MDKIKILEIAAEAGLSNNELLEKAKELGFNVEAASSAISVDEAGILVDYAISGKLPAGFAKDKPKAKKTTVKKQKKTEEETSKDTASKTESKVESKTKENKSDTTADVKTQSTEEKKAKTPPKTADSKAEGVALISIDQFFQTELKIGTVIEAQEVPKSKKLLLLQVDLGDGDVRQVVSGIKEWYSAEELLDTQVCVVANLKPAKLMGLKSEGMVLAAKDGDGLVLMRPEKPKLSGTVVS